MLREIFLYFCQSEYFNLPSKRRRGKSTFTVLLASYLHYTLRHDVLVVDSDYQSSDMRAVEQIPVRCRPGRRKPPLPTVAFSKMPGMEIRKARPSGDSHGLADFHLRRLIPCRRKEMTIFRDRGERNTKLWTLPITISCKIIIRLTLPTYP